jgi:hypothetical protein
VTIYDRKVGSASCRLAFLPESKMRAMFVVVTDVFRKQPFQMMVIERDEVV